MTALGCPPWCTSAPGHEKYSEVGQTDARTDRWHTGANRTGTFGEVDVSQWDVRDATGAVTHELSVDIRPASDMLAPMDAVLMARAILDAVSEVLGEPAM